MRVYQLALLMVSAALWAPTAAAQTLFTWPDTTVDLSTYTTIEACEAAATRVRDGVVSRAERVSGDWRDTMPRVPGEDREPWPAVVGETVRRCMARFAQVDSIPLIRYLPVVQLYLAAGWDDKATALVDRRLAAVAPDDEAELAAVLDTVVRIYRQRIFIGDLRVQPRREDLAQELVLEYLPRVSSRVKRLRVYRGLLVAADSLGQPTVHPLILERLVALTDSLTPQEREDIAEESNLGIEDSENLEERFFAVLDHILGKEAALDSLRRSTAAYEKLKRSLWTRVTGRPPETYLLGMPLGEPAPLIRADLWLGRTDTITARPTPGRVSLVVFISSGACVGAIDGPIYGNCGQRLIPLRRLQERFPELEVTVVARTHGYFMYVKDSLTLAREAELTKRWLESFGVRAPLAMVEVDHWRLPEPDGRRIDREVYKDYTFDGTWSVPTGGSGVLVDQDGLIVHASQLHRTGEHQLAELIEILLQRQVARS